MTDLRDISYVAIHMNMDKCIRDLQAQIKDKSGEEISLLDTSKILAEWYKNKSCNIEIQCKTNKRKRPCVTLNIL